MWLRLCVAVYVPPSMSRCVIHCVSKNVSVKNEPRKKKRKTEVFSGVTRLNFSGPMDNRFPFDNPAVLNVHSTGTDTEEELKLGWQLLASKILDSVEATTS